MAVSKATLDIMAAAKKKADAETAIALGKQPVAAASSVGAITPVTQTPKIIDTGARDAAGNLMVGQSNQNVIVTDAAKNRAATMAGQNTPQQQAAIREASTKKALSISPSINNYGATTPEQIAAQQKINIQYGLPEGTGIYGQGGLAKAPMVARDLAAEKSVVDKYGAPKNAEETKNYNAQAYTPEQLAHNIETGQTPASMYNEQELADLGLTPDRLQHLVDIGRMDPSLLARLKQIGGEGDQAAAIAAANPAPTNANLDILGEALNAKNNYKDQALGKSALFGMAGLDGFSVLQQSLGQRQDEMKQKLVSAQESLSMTGSRQLDAFKVATKHYEDVQKAYSEQKDRLLAIDAKATEWEQVQEQMKLQNDLDLKKQESLYKLQDKYRESNWSIQDITLPDGSKRSVQIDSNTGEIRQVTDENGNITEGEDVPNADNSPTPAAPAGSTYIGKQTVNNDFFNKFFKVGGYGGQCGTWASTISTANKVGNTWAEKRRAIQADGASVLSGKYTPKAGDKLLVPLAVKSGKGWGHVAVVTSYNPATGDIEVVEANKGLDGIIHKGKYNLNTIASKYGADNVGFVKGQLKGNGLFNKQLTSNETGAAALGGALGKMFGKVGNTPAAKHIQEAQDEGLFTIPEEAKTAGKGTTTAAPSDYTAAVKTMKFPSVYDNKLAQENIKTLVDSGDFDGAKGAIKQYAFNSSSAAQQSAMEGRGNAVGALERLRSSMAQYTGKGGSLGVFEGKEEGALEFVGQEVNPELATMANDVALAIIDYRKAVSGAAFTESEAKAYENVFPSIGKTPALNASKITSLMNKFNADSESFYKNRIPGYDKIFSESGDGGGETGKLHVMRNGVEGYLDSADEFDPSTDVKL